MKIPQALWPRLMPLLDEALALPAQAREAWLQRQQLGDELAAALRQLLADRAKLDGGEFMAALPPLAMPDEAPGAAARGRSDRGLHGAGSHAQGQPSSDGAEDTGGATQIGLFPGDLIGPYRLIRQLGQGGMSVVWLAERDDGQMRRQVALKMPHAGPGQALLAERLRRERDILASLEHRHIARLYDVGATPAGLPFLVLEYIEGQPLPAYCDAHRLGITERLQLFLQVLGAVQYAHTKLVLHRDLKPGNILVNAQGEVKLLDFGIAKLIQGGETGGVAPSTELTQHSGQVLTPDYAAPEQIAGTPLTTASDVYALGVILFELLTGQRPYRLPRGTRGALEEAILATDPRRPSQVWQDADVQTHALNAATLGDLATHFHASPRRLSQQLRGDLDVIVATALQKQTVRRYATAEAFAQDISHHLASEPIAAQPDSPWYRARKYAQRNAWALGAVGAVVTALSVGLGLALWQAQQARQEAAKANAIKDFLIGLFENGDVEQADALRKRQQTVEQLLVHSANALGSQLKDQPQVRVELQGLVGGLLHNLAITDVAIALRQQRLQQLEAMGAGVAERAQALRELADSQDARGDAAGARASLERGLALCHTAGMQPADVCFGLQVARGQMHALAREAQAARWLIEPAVTALRRSAPHSAQMAEALVGMGDVLSQQGDVDASFALYEEAMAIRSRLWGAASVRMAQERYALAMSLWQVLRLKQADSELQAAWQAMAKALGKEHLNTALIELQLGRLRLVVRGSRQGKALIDHAASVILAQRDKADPRWVFDAYLAQANEALFDGRLADARGPIEQVRALQAGLAEHLASDGLVDGVVAWYLDDIGQYAQALQVLRAAKARTVARLGPGSAYARRLDDALISSYLSAGKVEAAEQVWQASGGAQMGETLSGSSGQVALLLALGHFDEAARAIQPDWQAMQTKPRTEQTQLDRYVLLDQMGRIKLGQGRLQEARRHFEQAMAELAQGFAHNPYLAMTRARYGLCLLKLGDAAKARAELTLAQKALASQAQAAPHFKRPLLALQAALSAPP